MSWLGTMLSLGGWDAFFWHFHFWGSLVAPIMIAPYSLCDVYYMRMVRWGPRPGPREFHVEILPVSRNSASGVCLSKELLHPMMALQRNFWFRCGRRNAIIFWWLNSRSADPCASYGLSICRSLIACVNSGSHTLEWCTCQLWANAIPMHVICSHSYSDWFSILFIALWITLVCRMIWWNRSFQLCAMQTFFFMVAAIFMLVQHLFV